MRRSLLLIAITLSLYSPLRMRADLLSLGAISYDVLIPAPPSPGVNAFSIFNFTGPSDLPPDFPSLTAVTFKNATLRLFGTSTQTIALGDIGPGFLSPAASFPDNVNFSSAEFTATLDTTTFLLDGGGTFTATSANIDVFLVPSSGSSLSPGDFALISASNVPASVPEPSSWLSLGTVCALIFRRFRPSIRRF